MAGQSLKYEIQEDQGALWGEEGGEWYDGVQDSGWAGSWGTRVMGKQSAR